jgi:cytochrome oxidase Cu insertion factor (SCO1/SenC/PrrC family)
MKKNGLAISAWSMLVAALMGAAFLPATRAQEKGAQTAPALKVGDLAPDFTLKYFDGADMKDVSLKDFKGKKNVVLAFYVFAFTPG